MESPFKIRRKLRRVAGAVRRRALRMLPAALSWRSLAQMGELEFHRQDKWRPSPAFTRDSAKLFSELGFTPDQFRGRVLLDLGAGSRLRTKYFEDARLVALEPLAEAFMKELPWCDLKTAERVLSIPAEQMAADLRGAVDAVISINVLDHCYDLDRIIGNVAAYLRPDGLAFLSFDSHERADDMHPLVLNRQIAEQHFRAHGLVVRRFTTGVGSFGSSYGHGETMNFWLEKKAPPGGMGSPPTGLPG